MATEAKAYERRSKEFIIREVRNEHPTEKSPPYYPKFPRPLKYY
jgi:hypothetical protein